VFTGDERATYRERLHRPALFQKTWDYYYSKVS
jgi:hypothetical protein